MGFLRFSRTFVSEEKKSLTPKKSSYWPLEKFPPTWPDTSLSSSPSPETAFPNRCIIARGINTGDPPNYPSSRTRRSRKKEGGPGNKSLPIRHKWVLSPTLSSINHCGPEIDAEEFADGAYGGCVMYGSSRSRRKEPSTPSLLEIGARARIRSRYFWFEGISVGWLRVDCFYAICLGSTIEE